MNDLVSLIVFILACYGGANGIVYSRLLHPFRVFIGYKDRKYDALGNLTEATERSNPVSKFLHKLINCPLCVGFWLGIIYGLVIYHTVF
jgi:hypothetical protein